MTPTVSGISLGAGIATDVTVTFTTVTALASGDSVRFTFPTGYTFVAATPTTTGTNWATTGTVSSTALTIATTATVNAGAQSIVIKGVKSADTVSTASTLLVETVKATVTQDAGTVATPATSINLVKCTLAMPVGNAGSTFVWSFTPAADVALNGSIILTYPGGFMPSSTTACTSSTSTTFTNTVDKNVATLKVLTAATGTSAMTITCTNIAIGAALGATDLAVPTPNGFSLSTSVTTTAIVPVAPVKLYETLTLKSITNLPAVASTSNSTVFAFTTVSALVAKDTIVLTLPTGYTFGSNNATFATANTGATASSAASKMTVVLGANIAAGSAVSITVLSVTAPTTAANASQAIIETTYSSAATAAAQVTYDWAIVATAAVTGPAGGGGGGGSGGNGTGNGTTTTYPTAIVTHVLAGRTIVLTATERTNWNAKFLAAINTGTRIASSAECNAGTPQMISTHMFGSKIVRRVNLLNTNLAVATTVTSATAGTSANFVTSVTTSVTANKALLQTNLQSAVTSGTVPLEPTVTAGAGTSTTSGVASVSVSIAAVLLVVLSVLLQ